MEDDFLVCMEQSCVWDQKFRWKQEENWLSP